MDQDTASKYGILQSKSTSVIIFFNADIFINIKNKNTQSNKTLRLHGEPETIGIQNQKCFTQDQPFGINPHTPLPYENCKDN